MHQHCELICHFHKTAFMKVTKKWNLKLQSANNIVAAPDPARDYWCANCSIETQAT